MSGPICVSVIRCLILVLRWVLVLVVVVVVTVLVCLPVRCLVVLSTGGISRVST